MFTWIPFYEELATVILNFRNRQEELIELLKEIQNKKLPTIKLDELDINGWVPLNEIDPFTFYANFNRPLTDLNRIDILKNIKDRLKIEAAVPSDFEGIPVVHPQKAIFFPFKKERNPGDIQALWDLAEAAVTGELDVINKDLFNRCIKIKEVGVPKLTVGLFWLCPNRCMPFDKRSKDFFQEKGLSFNVSDFDSYKSFLHKVRETFQDDFPTLSWKAYIRYWQIAPGENAELWPDMKSNSIAAVGWDELNFDLSGKTKEELLDIYKVIYPEATDRQRKIGTTMLWNFLSLKPGDKLVTNEGQKFLLALGIVKGGYKFRPEREKFKHTIDVDYYNVSETGIPIPDEYKGKFGKTIVPLTGDTYRTLEKLFPQKNFWIFQANPEYYDLEGALQNCEEINWGISQHKDKVQKGDEVFLWLSGTNAGVYAVAEVLTDPGELNEEPCDKPFIKKPEKFEKATPDVRLSIIQVLERPVTRAMILAIPELKDLRIIKAPLGTNFLLTPEQAKILDNLINQPPNIYTINDFINDTGIPREIVKSWERNLLRKKHVVFQGPPGTGKTYIAERLARLIISGTKGFWDVVQFHPAYAYEDFIQGIRPKILEKGSGVGYELVNGRFKDFCLKASSDQTQGDPCVLIIDEINRANLARVFGELMYLLEYRDKEIKLASGGRPFHIPSNVYIIGTMNTADRSIALVDHALRRRFSFIRLKPDYSVLEKNLKDNGYSVDEANKLIEVLKEINQAIDDQNYEVGISFFMKDGNQLKAHLPDIWMSEIEPYLEEFFFDQPKKVDSFRWESLFQKELID